jgi:Ankyrin repeats (many copies)
MYFVMQQPINSPINSPIADPQVADPQVADPQVADPQVADPQVADPQVADPQVADPQVADPPVIQPLIEELTATQEDFLINVVGGIYKAYSQCDDFLKAAQHINEITILLLKFQINPTTHIIKILLPNLDYINSVLLDTYQRTQNIYKTFYWMCENGYLDTVKWLSQLTCIGPCANRGDIKCEVLPQCVCEQVNHFDIHHRAEGGFRYACEYGQLQVAKYLYSLGANPNTWQYDALQYASLKGHLDVVHWLYSLDLYEVGAEMAIVERKSFVFACSRGHLSTAQYIYAMLVSHNYITDDDDDFLSNIMSEACSSDHLNIAKWLSEFNTLDPDEIVDTFEECCINSSLDVIRWLHDTYHVQINCISDCMEKLCEEDDCDGEYNYATYERRAKIFAWLYERYPDKWDEGCIVYLCESGQIYILEFVSGCVPGLSERLPNILTEIYSSAEHTLHRKARAWLKTKNYLTTVQIDNFPKNQYETDTDEEIVANEYY